MIPFKFELNKKGGCIFLCLLKKICIAWRLNVVTHWDNKHQQYDPLRLYVWKWRGTQHNSWQSISTNDTDLINSLKSKLFFPCRASTNYSSLDTMSCQVCVHHCNPLWVCSMTTGFTSTGWACQFCCDSSGLDVFGDKRKTFSGRILILNRLESKTWRH